MLVESSLGRLNDGRLESVGVHQSLPTTSATKAGITTTYAVNALGQRVKKTVNSVSRYFVYDKTGHLTGEYDNSGALIQETLWLGNTPVATIRPNGANVAVFYIHSDHLNTPKRISRSSDNVVVWRWDGDPFGTTQTNQDPDGDATTFTYMLRFSGQYYDAETELSHNYFRDYVPSIGRYAQSDPIGLKGGLNTYTYVRGIPLSYVDPLGLQEVLPIPGVPGLPAYRPRDFTPGTREYNDLVDSGQRAWDEFFDRLFDNFDNLMNSIFHGNAESAGEEAANELETEGVCPPGDGGGSDNCKQIARKCNARCREKWRDVESDVVGSWLAVCEAKCASRFGCGTYFKKTW